ncbi:MAG TPA: ATP-binding protein [Spirochaetota bacterium]|nr:ATP-binding protein [Spirochaetota bacterium]
MQIAVASGKGGTGKTTIALSLAYFFKEENLKVAILDCDVEEPNVNLFLNLKIQEEKSCNVMVPYIDKSLCSACGECERICQFSAIVLVKGKPLFFPEMCHSCGGCTLICPEKAIKEIARETAKIEISQKDNLFFAGGKLNIGEAMSPPVIRQVKENFIDADIRIIDSPPGTSCPVIESVREANFLILVTEPTLFGLNDLSLAIEMARALKIPSAVVINKSSKSDYLIKDLCKQVNIPIIGAIPEDREIAENYSKGEFISVVKEKYNAQFKEIINHIKNFRRIYNS